MATQLILYAIREPGGCRLDLKSDHLYTEDRLKDKPDLISRCYTPKFSELEEKFKNASDGAVIEKSILLIPGKW